MNVYDKLNDPIAFTVFIATLLLPVFVGFFVIHRMKNQADFFVGGRAMGKFVVALSAVSSGRSSWLVLGMCGLAYSKGVAAVWALVGYIVVEMFQFIYIGRKLRAQTEQYKSITLLDYFTSRFNDKKNVIRIVGAVIIILFLMAYIGAQLKGGAESLKVALNIPLIASLAITAALILVYMVLGGYVAVAYNDVIRAIIMIVGLVVLPTYGIIKAGGIAKILSILQSLNPAYVDPFSFSIGGIIGLLGIGLGSPGQPHIIVRYMSIDDPERLRSSAVIGTFWNVVLGWGALFIGLLGRALKPEVAQLPEKNHELIYLALASDTFGPIFYGLLIGGVFAAILSTADSQLLVLASTFVRDIYEKIIRKDEEIAEHVRLRMSRIVVIIAGLLALILAYFAKDMIFWLVLFAWGGLGASFGTSLIFSLYWKRTTKYGVIAGMLTGTVVTIIWKLFLKKTTGIYELIPAFSLAALAIFIVSLVTYREEGT